MSSELSQKQLSPADVGFKDGIAIPEDDVLNAFAEAVWTETCSVDEAGMDAGVESKIGSFSLTSVQAPRGKSVMPERLQTTPEGDVFFLRVIGGMIAHVRKDVKKTFRGLMHNVESMNGILESARGNQQVREILRVEIARLDALREKVETPELKVAILGDLRRAISEILGITDLDVELLSTEDALKYGCKALYTSAKDGNRAKISIPISKYGSAELIDSDALFFDYFITILAYHCISTKLVEELPPDHRWVRLYNLRPGEQMYGAKFNMTDDDFHMGIQSTSLDEAVSDFARNANCMIRDEYIFSDAQRISCRFWGKKEQIGRNIFPAEWAKYLAA